MTVPYALFFESSNCPYCGYLSNYPDDKNISASTFDLFIIDEIQDTKNPKAKRTKAVRSIKCKYKWALSGTPLENKIEDLITICETIKPDIFKNRNPFIQSELDEVILQCKHKEDFTATVDVGKIRELFGVLQ